MRIGDESTAGTIADVLTFAIENPTAAEDLWLTIGSIASCIAVIVVGLIALRNRKR
jgi:hypothetical protein